MLKEKIDKYTDKLKTKKPEYRRPLLALPAGMNSSYLEAAQTSRDGQNTTTQKALNARDIRGFVLSKLSCTEDF